MDKENEVKHLAVETYAEDMAQVIQDDREGLVKKIIHEQEQREAERKNFSPESKKNKFYMFLSIVLVFSALGILFFSILKNETTSVEIQDQFVPFLPSEKSFFIEVAAFDKTEIASSIRNELARSDLRQGGVEGIYLTKNKTAIMGLREFISIFEMSFVPGDPALISDSFLIGITNIEQKELFFLFKVRSMLDIFGPMRAWEREIFPELYDLFGFELNSENNYLLYKEWQDGVIENKNARILTESGGNIVMMYVFADDASVVILSGRNGAKEVMLRLQQSQIKK
ncbi:MAG: hypothetical protein WD991_01420 [Candidatus Paceibacterota bacterium]